MLWHLYRVARLPKMLGLWIRDYLQLLSLLGINPDQVKNFDVLERVIEAAEWIRSSGFNVHELQALRHKSSNRYVSLTDPEANVRALCEELSAAMSVALVLESDLTAIDGVSPLLAADLFDDLVNSGFISKTNAADRHGILTETFQPGAQGFTLQPLTAPFDAAATEGPVIAALAAHDPKQIILGRLGAFFDMDPLMVGSVIEVAAFSLNDAHLLGWLTTPIPDAAPIPQGLSVFLAAVRAYQLLLREVTLEPAEVPHMTAHPAYYNIDNAGNLSFDNVRRSGPIRSDGRFPCEPRRAARLCSMAAIAPIRLPRSLPL